MFGKRSGHDLGGKRLQQQRVLTNALLEACVVQLVAQAAVQLCEPFEARLIEHESTVALGAHLRPFAHELLQGVVQSYRQGQLVAQARHHGEIGEAVLAEELAEHAPVVRVIPHDLDGQHLGIAEHCVLIRVERERAAIEGEIEMLVQARIGRDPFAREVLRDQLGDVGVRDGDEVAAGRIERVEEHARFAGQRPARAGKHLLAAVGKASERDEIL
jgi:hypothetical protein